MSKEEIKTILLSSDLFKDIPMNINSIYMKKYHSGQIVSETINKVPCVGIIIYGYLDVYSVAYDGTDIHLNTLRKGDCYGISNLLIHNELETVIQARTETKVLCIPKELVKNQLATNSEFALKYVSYCNQKIQFLIKRIELLTTQSSRGKVVEFLLSNMDHNNKVIIPYTKEILAKNLGISRAGLFRELSYLGKHDVICTHNNTIHVSNTEFLLNILHNL